MNRNTPTNKHILFFEVLNSIITIITFVLQFSSVSVFRMITSHFASSVESSVAQLEAAAHVSKSHANRQAAAILRDILLMKVANEMIRVAEEEMELSLWDTVEGDDVNAAMDTAKRKDDPEKLESALKLVKRKIDNFIKFLSEGPQQSDDDESDVFTSAPSFR